MAPPPRLPSLRLNVIANFVGRGWSSALGLVLTPVYLKLLGVESYGLIGMYASVIAILGVLDLGLSSTLNRELARLSATGNVGDEGRNLVRTLEVIYLAIGLAVGVVLVAASPYIARDWVHGNSIPPHTVRLAFAVMGLVAAVEWPSALYTGGLGGLQRQVLLNGIKIAAGTIQGVGAVLILRFVSPTVTAFFSWQLATAILQTFVLGACQWRSISRSGASPAFDARLLRKNVRFAAGMTGISLMATLLTQVDKLVVSRLLSLEDFGRYVLAFNVSASVGLLVQPLVLGVFPRLSQLAMAQDWKEVSVLYHRTCQFLSVIVLPAAAIVTFYSRELLSLWLKDGEIADRTWPLLTIAMIGSALNALATPAYILQLATGWTRLSFVKNVIGLAASIPLLVALVRWRGTSGAAGVWIFLNAGYVLLEIPYMHTRLLPSELRRWYSIDVAPALVIAVTVAWASRAFMPSHAPPAVGLAWIALSGVLALVGAACATPATREWARREVLR